VDQALERAEDGKADAVGRAALDHCRLHDQYNSVSVKRTWTAILTPAIYQHLREERVRIIINAKKKQRADDQ